MTGRIHLNVAQKYNSNGVIWNILKQIQIWNGYYGFFLALSTLFGIA